MVFLAITRKGFESYRSLSQGAGALWVGAGVLSDSELVELRGAGINVSNFDYTIDPQETKVLASAIETIKEHHPGMVVWAES